MNKQDLDDLLAFIEMRNITLAARRRNVSQPAYSRRLQAIEASRNIELVDRTSRPACPTPALDATRGEIEQALVAIARVHQNMMLVGELNQDITIAASHALTSGILPAALGRISHQINQQRIHIRSANQDECFQMLMMEKVSMMLSYETRTQTLREPKNLVSKNTIATDWLVPVCNPADQDWLSSLVPGSERIPLVSYPRELFLGRVMSDDIISACPHQFSETLITGFTSASIASVRAGLGMSWQPWSIIANELDTGQLVLLGPDRFPHLAMDISMLQLRTRTFDSINNVWQPLTDAIKQVVENMIPVTFK